MGACCKFKSRPRDVGTRIILTFLRYVGADDGIYEYHVNVAGRKKFPSIVLR